MRIHKAIENIQAAIDRHQDEWLKDNGFEPEEHERKRTAEPAPAVKTPKLQTSAQFSANRFLGGTTAKTEPESSPAPEPEPEQQTESQPAEIVSVVGLKEQKHHSWLYNEVLDAINDAAENNKGTKIIAVFIPIVRSGEEFKDLPVDASITLPPVYDENVHVEELPPFKELLEEPEQEQETEQEESEPVSLEKSYDSFEAEPVQEESAIMTETESEPEQSAEEYTITEPEQQPAAEITAEPTEVTEDSEFDNTEIEPEPDTVQEEPEPESLSLPEPEPEAEIDAIAETEPETESEEQESVGDILSAEPENPEELQDIFRTMEEKLEDTSQPEQPEEGQPEETVEAPEEPEMPDAGDMSAEFQELTEDEAEGDGESEKFENELVDAIMEENLEDGQEEQNIDFEDLESEPETDSDSGQTMEFTEVEQLEPAEAEDEEPAAEPEHIMLRDIALTAEAPAEITAEPAEETEDDEFDDTEILPDTEKQE